MEGGKLKQDAPNIYGSDDEEEDEGQDRQIDVNLA